MNLDELLKNKSLKPKEKTEAIAEVILNGEMTPGDIIFAAVGAKDTVKATYMEAFEYATNKNPEIATMELFSFASEHLSANAPRLKWESAKVIGNIAHLYADHLEPTIASLLENSRDDGTVVRWSAAYALSAIFRLTDYANDDFRSQLVSICETEEKNSIKKIYLKALKN